MGLYPRVPAPGCSRQGKRRRGRNTARAGQGPRQGSARAVASAVARLPPQDFETNNELRGKVISFLEEVMHDPELLTQERKAAANIIR